jgi:hypothetical protein
MMLSHKVLTTVEFHRLQRDAGPDLYYALQGLLHALELDPTSADTLIWRNYALKTLSSMFNPR